MAAAPRGRTAPGVDGVEAADHAQNLRGDLEALLHAFKSGSYRAPLVRRVYIPEADGSKTRPLGIPTVEDRILQKAVAMVLEAVYEHGLGSSASCAALRSPRHGSYTPCRGRAAKP